MENPLVRTIFPQVKIMEGASSPRVKLVRNRLQVDQLATEATLLQMFQGYGLPLEKLCVTESDHCDFLVRHGDKLNRRGSSFFLTAREGELFVLHTCMWRNCCEVFEEDLRSSSRIWLPEFGHRIIVPKIN